MFINFLRKIINLFEKKKPFICRGEHCIEIVEGNRFKALIWYREPTSEELLEYAHTALEYTQSELSDLAKQTVPDFNFKDLHLEMFNKKIVPFAKKIIIKWENYFLADGKEVAEVQQLIDHYHHHIQQVVHYAFEQKTSFKKKF